MGAEDRDENLDKEGYRWLGKMLQCHMRKTVRVRSLDDLKALDGFLNLVRVGESWFAAQGHEVGPQRHLSNCRDRRNRQRLKRSLQTVGKGLAFSESGRSVPPR
jgi:hypothetical protein